MSINTEALTGTDSSVTITSYGQVGETIEGTFAGEVLHSTDNSTGPLTAGAFRLRRGPDRQ